VHDAEQAGQRQHSLKTFSGGENVVHAGSPPELRLDTGCRTSVGADNMFLQTSSTWLLNLFLNNIWLAIGFWTVLYALDYIFTMTQARFYRAGAHRHFGFSEGLELNPFFRDDVAKIRTFSFRFFLMLFFVAGLLFIIYALNFPEGFALVWGMVVGIQLANHCRHIRNLVVMFYARASAGISGRARYEHWFSLRLSSVDFFCFGLLFLLLYLFWGNLFALGASLGCFSLALRHLMDSVKKRKSKPKDES